MKLKLYPKNPDINPKDIGKLKTIDRIRRKCFSQNSFRRHFFVVSWPPYYPAYLECKNLRGLLMHLPFGSPSNVDCFSIVLQRLRPPMFNIIDIVDSIIFVSSLLLFASTYGCMLIFVLVNSPFSVACFAIDGQRLQKTAFSVPKKSIRLISKTP